MNVLDCLEYPFEPGANGIFFKVLLMIFRVAAKNSWLSLNQMITNKYLYMYQYVIYSKLLWTNPNH